jgi:hypothetical protein
MKQAFCLVRRPWGVLYLKNKITGDQKSLETSDKFEAQRILGAEIKAILKRRPAVGPLFPYLRTVRAGDRATEFRQRCDGLEISGASLHSYRHVWAERA